MTLFPTAFRNNFLLIFLLGFSTPLGAQIKFEKPRNNPDTLYYQFYNGVQMIEIDHAAAWEREVGWYEGTQPRALEWSSLIPRPPANVYLLRDSSGKIIRAFNSPLSINDQNNHFKNISLKRSNKALLQHKNTGLQQRRMYSRRFINTEGLNGSYLVNTVMPDAPNSINRVNGKAVGLIDSLGNFIFPIVYDLIEKHGNNYLVKKDGYFGIINKESKIILPLEYDMINAQTETVLVFSKRGKLNCCYDIKKGTITKMDDYDWIDNDRLNDMEHDKSIMLIRVRKKGKTGFINKNYIPVTPILYDHADYYFKEGLLLVNREKKWGYINIKGEEIIPCQFEDAMAFDMGSAPVILNGTKMCINPKKETIAPCENKYSAWSIEKELGEKETFIDGRHIVRRNYTYGLTDNSNNLIVPIIYQRISGIEIEGRTRTWHQQFYKVRSNDKWGVINKNGDEVLPCEYDMIDEFKSGDLISVGKNELYGLLDKSFNWVIPCKYEGLDHYTYPGKIWFHEKNLKGLMNYDQSIIIPLKYTEAGWLSEGRIRVSIGKLSGFIDTLGNEIIPLKYDLLGSSFYNGLITAGSKNKWGFIDLLNNNIIPFQYDEVRNFEKNITGVKKGKKFAFINRNNETVTEFIYEFIGHNWYVDSLVQVTRNGKIGFVNESGKESIPCIYDEDRGFNPKTGHYLRKGNVWMEVKGNIMNDTPVKQ